MIERAIKRAFQKGRDRGWTKLSVAVDIHDTVVRGNYSREDLAIDFFPVARMCLQHLSARRDINLILYSCSHEEDMARYRDFFLTEDIVFDSCNENLWVTTKPGSLGNYDKKMYFDILFEDKAGFDPMSDWATAYNIFKLQPILKGQELPSYL